MDYWKGRVNKTFLIICVKLSLNKFNSFFVDKIRKIRADQETEEEQISDPEPVPDTLLHGFTPIAEQTIDRFIMNSSNATCESDPLPTWLLKKMQEIPLANHHNDSENVTRVWNISNGTETCPGSTKAQKTKPG